MEKYNISDDILLEKLRERIRGREFDVLWQLFGAMKQSREYEHSNQHADYFFTVLDYITEENNSPM